jgi:hypothetical protein
MELKDDPTIERIREARHEISAKNNHDPQEIVRYYIELQKRYQDRILTDPKNEKEHPTKT